MQLLWYERPTFFTYCMFSWCQRCKRSSKAEFYVANWKERWPKPASGLISQHRLVKRLVKVHRIWWISPGLFQQGRHSQPCDTKAKPLHAAPHTRIMGLIRLKVILLHKPYCYGSLPLAARSSEEHLPPCPVHFYTPINHLNIDKLSHQI